MLNLVPQREPQNQIYLENDQSLFNFFNEMVTVVTPDIVYIPMLKGTF